MLKVICVLLAVVAVVYAQAGSQYCKQGLCPPGKKHVACGNDGKLGPKCSPGAQVVRMNSELKQLVLDTHNKYRDQTAQGKTPGYEPASRMATMKWSNELAKLAQLNANTCDFGHDKCRNTAKFKFAGQSISQPGLSNDFYPDKKVITDSIDGWFSEYPRAGMRVINSYPYPADGDYGHFTQIVRDQAYEVGCAITKFKQSGFFMSYVVCNYAVTNMGNEPIYAAGATASGCTTGTNSQYPGLCSENEKFTGVYFN